MFVLDTNVVSELRRGKANPSGAVRAWAGQQAAARLYLSAIGVFELELGVRRLERRDRAQGLVLRGWLQGVLDGFEGRILGFTSPTASRCAALHVPDPRSFRDSMISATALEHGFAVATRNVADFIGIGVAVVNPWEFVVAPLRPSGN